MEVVDVLFDPDELRPVVVTERPEEGVMRVPDTLVTGRVVGVETPGVRPEVRPVVDPPERERPDEGRLGDTRPDDDEPWPATDEPRPGAA